METLGPYLFLWNNWIVLPALLAAAAWAHWRYRKRSTLAITVGLVLVIAGQVVRTFYPAPLHPAYIASVVCEALGILAAIGGFIWFMRKDYRRTSTSS